MTHAELVLVAAHWLRRRGCHAVLTERGHHQHGEIPDAIGWQTQFDGQRLRTHAVVVEVKVSRSDYLKDAEKPHRANTDALGRQRFYLAPKGLLKLDEIPFGWGFLEYNGRQVRHRLPATKLDPTVESVERERTLLIHELRAYHAQGITYKHGKERWTVPA